MKDQKNQNDIEWLLSQASKGYPLAQYRLAVKYENGIGVEIDIRKAIDWYLQAEGPESTNAARLAAK